MTEAMTTTNPGGTEKRPRCLERDPLGGRCWREAAERRYSNDGEPTICAEHLRALELNIKESELLNHLDELGAWIATWDDPKEGETRLQYHAFTTRQSMVEELWGLSIEARAADLIADRGPEEKPFTLEQAQRLAEYDLRTRTLFHAGQMFQDLQMVPEETFGGESNRWRMAGALCALDDDVSAEEKRYRQDLGLR